MDNFVLKGGLFIYSLTEFDSRVTVDVDFLIRRIPNTPEQLKSILEEIIATDTGNDYVSFEIKNVLRSILSGKQVRLRRSDADGGAEKGL